MGPKLIERSLVKTRLRMPLADTVNDELINSLIQAVSEEAERYTRRKFTYGKYEEFFPSYEQTEIGVDYQILLVKAYPIDLGQPVYLAFSPNNHVSQSVNVLQWSLELASSGAADFLIEPELGRFDVVKMGSVTLNLPTPARAGFTYAERGFRAIYWGGYPVSEQPSGAEDDPLDDYGVVQIPEGLKHVIADKVVGEYRVLKSKDSYFQRGKQLAPYEAVEERFRRALTTWVKKDQLP